VGRARKKRIIVVQTTIPVVQTTIPPPPRGHGVRPARSPTRPHLAVVVQTTIPSLLRSRDRASPRSCNPRSSFASYRCRHCLDNRPRRGGTSFLGRLVPPRLPSRGVRSYQKRGCDGGDRENQETGGELAAGSIRGQTHGGRSAPRTIVARRERLIMKPHPPVAPPETSAGGAGAGPGAAPAFTGPRYLCR
jgi:hypothetical protein